MPCKVCKNDPCPICTARIAELEKRAESRRYALAGCDQARSDALRLVERRDNRISELELQCVGLRGERLGYKNAASHLAARIAELEAELAIFDAAAPGVLRKMRERDELLAAVKKAIRTGNWLNSLQFAVERIEKETSDASK